MKTRLDLISILIVLTAVAGSARLLSADTENWPAWRGPDGNSNSRATGLPTSWAPEKNIVWKAELPAWSGSTPVIWGDRIFLMSPSKSAGGAAESGPTVVGLQDPPPRQRPGGGFRRGGGFGQGRDPGGQQLLLMCFSKANGKPLWQKVLDTGNRVYMKHNNTSPSPVTDGKHVWALTGTGVVAAFDTSGNEKWKRNLQTDYGTFGLNWGYGSSPLLHDGKLIVQVLHGMRTDDPSYVVALDAATGKEVWKQERPTDAPSESPDAYTTPVIATVDGKSQIIVSGGDYVTGHDPKTGKEIWRAGGLNPTRSRVNRIVGSPTVMDGLVYAPSRNRPILALKPGGTGDVTESATVWKFEDPGGPDVPTPVSDGKYLYVVNDRGMITCLDAKSGKLIYGPERTASGTVDSSPLLADGKIYITNESAVTTVIAAGPEFKVLSTNALDGSYTLSSIAVSGKQLFVRTGTNLYCIEE